PFRPPVFPARHPHGTGSLRFCSAVLPSPTRSGLSARPLHRGQAASAPLSACRVPPSCLELSREPFPCGFRVLPVVCPRPPAASPAPLVFFRALLAEPKVGGHARLSPDRE